ncbi:hypothetical protein FOZ62_030655 [Perkinsus olseni]|uniref:Uncharacterized protein n=1 Tax=Perkinsus olseni TaxID=32597 RepID=A0A7J6R6Z3_PEROL|nr:hypothetical protein FOZ62_030655 [Perkinsus olseni]
MFLGLVFLFCVVNLLESAVTILVLLSDLFKSELLALHVCTDLMDGRNRCRALVFDASDEEFIANLIAEDTEDLGSKHERCGVSDTTLEVRQRATLGMAKAGIAYDLDVRVFASGGWELACDLYVPSKSLMIMLHGPESFYRQLSTETAFNASEKRDEPLRLTLLPEASINNWLLSRLTKRRKDILAAANAIFPESAFKSSTEKCLLDLPESLRVRHVTWAQVQGLQGAELLEVLLGEGRHA